MAPAFNANIWYTKQESYAARLAEQSESFDGAFIYEGITTNATPKELYLRHVQTEGMTINSVVENTELTRLALPHKGLSYVKGTVLGLRADTSEGAAHLVAEFAASVYHPDTTNAAASGTNAIVDAIDAVPTYAAVGNPAERVIVGDATDLTVGINSQGYITITVTGNASQEIHWRAWIDSVRSLCHPNYIGRNI